MTDITDGKPDRELKQIAINSLGEKASQCIACDLAKTRTKVVFGYGNPTSPLMLVGEGPGANEDATGLPFVGRAGKVLDECLKEAGMKREHVYIANIVKCRACNIEGKKILNRPPTPEESSTCVSLWLEKQIEIIQPAVILCIGAPSANALIHKNFKITQERGKWLESRYAQYVMAALHPSYILRQESVGDTNVRQTLIDDLITAKEKAKAAKNEPKLTLL